MEAAAIFYGVSGKCCIPVKNDISKYYIKTTGGGCYIAYVNIPSKRSDPDYTPVLSNRNYFACGSMYRFSGKYPFYSWSIDTEYSSRQGGWQNNMTADYEYLYEFMKNSIEDNEANAEKFARLRERSFITPDNKVNIMVVKEKAEEFFGLIPELDEDTKKKFACFAIENAEIIARRYPVQMRDLIINHKAGGFISNTVAIMVADILYGNNTFRALTENEKTTSNLIMFSDILPKA